MTNWMEMALDEARTAAARGEVPVGAVLVRGETLIAASANRSEELRDATAHAEILVIRTALAKQADKFLDDCTLYVTLEPCAMCAATLAAVRIGRLIFGAYDTKAGAVTHGIRLFDHPSCLHKPHEIIGGMHESECEKLLKDFFKTLR